MKQKRVPKNETLNLKTAYFGESYVKRFMINKGFKLVGEHIRGFGYEIDLLFLDAESGAQHVTEVKTRKVGSFDVIYETLEREKRSIHKKMRLLSRFVDKIVSYETVKVCVRYFYVFILSYKKGSRNMKVRMVEIVF